MFLCGCFVLRHSLLFICLCFFQDNVSLCSPGFPGTSSVYLAGLELKDIPWPCLLSAGIKGGHHHCVAETECYYAALV